MNGYLGYSCKKTYFKNEKSISVKWKYLNIFENVSVTMPEHIKGHPSILEKSQSWIFEVRTLYHVYGSHMYALKTWDVLFGHEIEISSTDMEYALRTWDTLFTLRTWNILFGHDIRFLDMEYAVWTWYILSRHGIYSLDLICNAMIWQKLKNKWYALIWSGLMWSGMIYYKMIWYDMTLYDILLDVRCDDMIVYGIIWYCLIWYDLTWSVFIWCDIIWYYMILYDVYT